MVDRCTDVDDDHHIHRQLSISGFLNPESDSDANNAVTAPPISVPDGWIIQHVPHYHDSGIDTYYFEPETGRKFQSVDEIARYLKGNEYTASRSGPSKLKISGDTTTVTPAENQVTLKNKQIVCSQKETFESYSWIKPNFVLPEGWRVERVPRKCGKIVDKFYRDPKFGRRFRSLKDVERYLMEENSASGSTANKRNSLNDHATQLHKSNKREKIGCSEKVLDLHEDKDKDDANKSKVPWFSHATKLPPGWVVQHVPRKSSETHIDRYYYEPGTQKKFRSLAAAMRHIAEQEQNSSSSKKEQCSSSNSPQNDINWSVITNTSGERWNPYGGDAPVPDHVMPQWSTTFGLFVDGCNPNAANSGDTGMNPGPTF